MLLWGHQNIFGNGHTFFLGVLGLFSFFAIGEGACPQKTHHGQVEFQYPVIS